LKSNRHRAEVIEVYDGGNSAAVKFSSGRIEHVVRRGSFTMPFSLGQRGHVDFVPSLNGWEWTFEPFAGPI
jgi:hypothetical protein